MENNLTVWGTGASSNQSNSSVQATLNNAGVLAEKKKGGWRLGTLEANLSRVVETHSWVTGFMVRLFLSEDAPSQSGVGTQDLQAKASWLLHSVAMGYDDQPPPGFEGPRPVPPQIVVVNWKCPPRLVLNPEWQVVAGEESKEAEIQKQREHRVLEAVYPRLSAIPPSPSDSSDLHQYQHDDRLTPLIPILPIEDDEVADVLDSVSQVQASKNLKLPCFPNSLTVAGNTPASTTASSGVEDQSRGNAHHVPIPSPIENPGIGVIPGVEPDVVAAASAAFTAIMRSNEEGSLIDRDLLIKILSNPKLLEQLILEHGNRANHLTSQNPNSVSHTTASSPILVHANRMESDIPLATPTSSLGQFPSISKSTVPASNLWPASTVTSSQITTTEPIKAAPVKDINYYKSLIQQHGGERTDAQDQNLLRLPTRPNQNFLGTKGEALPNSKPREVKPKVQKPCMYFNSPTGCRHGANCMFQHDVSFRESVGSVPETQSAKRIKLERRELTGRS